MTQVITRLFDTERHANGVRSRLRSEGLPVNAVRVIAAADGEKQDALVERLMRADVHSSAAEAYAKNMQSGQAALVVHATHRPLGAAKITRNVIAQNGGITVGNVTEEHYVKEAVSKATSILPTHPRMMTPRVDQARISNGGPISQGLGPKLLVQPRKKSSAISGGRYMSRFFWPMPLLKKNRKASSAISGGRHMSRAFWPMPLISRRERSLSVISGRSQPVSDAMGFPTTQTR